MKIKLLKIVRKRFKILRYDKIDNPNHVYYNAPQFPFYVLTDSKNIYHDHANSDYEIVYGVLCMKIKKYYYNKHKTINPVKVWW